MVSDLTKKDLEKQGYRFVGAHSAVKVCDWCKKAIRSEGVCYKSNFYGIRSWRCVQMSPAFSCTHRCIFCWRNIEETSSDMPEQLDTPKEIVESCIKEQVKFLQGFGGNEKRNEERYGESNVPLHFAVSLIGEPCLYQKLPELVDEIKSRKMSAFLVTNGTVPKMLKKLIAHQPTQLYLTLPAANEKIYQKTCNPIISDGWKKINESLSLLKQFNRSCIRLTLVKGINMFNPEQYAQLIKQASPDFVELKAYMFVGHSRLRLEIKNMPFHEDIKKFAESITKEIGWKIIAEKPESRVILLMKEDKKDRILAV